MKNILTVLILFIGMAGCATAPQVNYFQLSSDRLSKKIKPVSSLFIVTKDSRPYVLNGKKKRSFMGLVRLYGAPISVNSRNGELLSLMYTNHMMAVLNDSFTIIKGVGINDNSPFVNFLDYEHDKSITLEVFEWKFDAPDFGRTAFYYDIEVSVYDNNKTLLARHRTKDKTIVNNKQYGWNFADAAESAIDVELILKALNK